MTKSQLYAIQRITYRVQQRASSFLEPGMSWKVEDLGRGTMMVVGSNVESDLRWFEDSRFVQAFVGPRGGIKIAKSTDRFYARAI